MTTPTHRTRQLSWIAASVVLLVCIPPVAGQTEPQEQDAIEGIAPPAPSEYTGPTILSRGNLPAIGHDSAPTTIQPFFYINQIYDTGMSVTSGTLGVPLQPVAGVETGFGLRGTHRWRRIILDVSYEGNYRQYTQQTGLAGTNQYLRTTAIIPLKRHLDLAFRQTVASLIQDVISLSLQPAELSGTLPANEPYDNRARLFDSQAILSYQKSQRLSFTASMEGSVTQRDSLFLVGSNAVSVKTDVGYLLTRHATIGLDYDFSHYGYTTFGSADINTVGGNLSWRLSRTVDVAVQFGVSHRDILGLAVVPVDPNVSALLGVNTGILVSRDVYDAPAFHFQVSKRWHHAGADIGYQKGISSGNGLILTSDTTSVTTGFHYIPSRNWIFSFNAGRTAMQALTGMQGLTGTTVSSYAGYVANVSLIRTIRPAVQLVARFDARPFTYLGAGLQTRTFYSSSIGFRFTPREVPLVLR